MALLSDVIQQGTRAGQPAATTVAAGTLYSVSDESGILERSDGTNWDSVGGSAGGGSDILQATKTLTNGELGSLSTTPIEIIAAPGAGISILVINGLIEMNVPTGYGANLTVRLVLGTDGSYTYAMANTLIGGFGAARNWVAFTLANPGQQTAAQYDRRNQALNIKGTTDIGTGDAAATLKVTVSYMLVTSI